LVVKEAGKEVATATMEGLVWACRAAAHRVAAFTEAGHQADRDHQAHRAAAVGPRVADEVVVGLRNSCYRHRDKR